MKIIIGATSNDGSVYPAIFWQALDPTTGHVVANFSSEITGLTGSETAADIMTKAITCIIADALSVFSFTITADDLIWPSTPFALLSPMIVAGVAKSDTYQVAAQPAVAGGSGAARFYVDSNGDGTGTAPSEIELSTLQAYVVNTSAVYVIGSISADTNRKYIDITMKALTFTAGLAGILSVITGANLANAANGVAVNCVVTVKK